MGIKEKLEEKGVNVTAEINEGAIVPSINETAKKEDVDLIAMHTHPRLGLAHLFKESYAEQLVHDSPVPVLLVH